MSGPGPVPVMRPAAAVPALAAVLRDVIRYLGRVPHDPRLDGLLQEMERRVTDLL